LLVEKYPHYKIVNFDKMDYCSSLKNVEQSAGKPNYKFIKGNILNPDFLRFVLETEEIDTIMHFAAQSHVDRSFGNSLTFTENNILGTHNLLEAARLCPTLKRFLHVSTDEVYGEAGSEGKEGEEHHEATLLQPTNPYAATKAGAELLVQSYNKSYKLPTVITRGNNVYGPGQYPEKVIPKFILQLKSGIPCTIHGNGNQKRSFIYISDVANAFDTILHKGTVGNIYNIGTSREITMLSVANELVKLMKLEGKEKQLIQHTQDRLFNDFRYAVNFDKINALGWSAKVSWEEGLKKTLEWYTSRDMHDYFEGVESILSAHPHLFTN